MLTIRREEPRDRLAVETLTRRAFYNRYIPGCVEHYLVHILRGHENFIPELDLVLELDGQISGMMMYTKAWLTDEAGREKEVLTFGPVCIAPEHQRKGYGTQLMEHSFAQAAAWGGEAIVIFGSPANYVNRDSAAAKNTASPWKTGNTRRLCWCGSWSPALWAAGNGFIGAAR